MKSAKPNPLSAVEHRAYERKIKTPQQLRKILGPLPRKKKAIMCHGTFDLVHPGHIRHLIYAKSKADILITSLTSDMHIQKANFRPFVPQDLRAMNLAALEVVDYVVIDDNPTPIENLKIIRPDYFAKGYEYNKGGLHPKTKEEKDALESYGGEILFTPGDIVFSSSHIIEAEPPNLAADKLHALMQAEDITFDNIQAPIGQNWMSIFGVRPEAPDDFMRGIVIKDLVIGGKKITSFDQFARTRSDGRNLEVKVE